MDPIRTQDVQPEWTGEFFFSGKGSRRMRDILISADLSKPEGELMRDHTDTPFGLIAVQKGLITPQQVLDALNIQIQENLNGKIGEILLEQ
jgi:hypothetical protein